jgi:beta-fructofuranosidase
MPNEMDQWYGHCNWNQHFHWRDPYLYKQEETGQYYLFICASSKTPGKFQGCIGLAVSDRISGTYKLLPPVVVAPANAAEAWAFYHMERPQVIYRNGQYHLFFSCFKMFLNPQWLQTVDQRKITNSTLHWYVADKIDGTYKPAMPGTSIVAGSERSGMYGTTLLEIAPSAWIAYGWYHRLHELEVSPTFQFLWRDDRPCLQPMTNADAATLNCLFK